MDIFDKAFGEVRETKKKLDLINYKGLYDESYRCYWKNDIFLPGDPGTDNKVRLEPLRELNPQNPIVNAYGKINNILSSNTKIGVVSNGVHGFDFFLRYFPNVEKSAYGSWNISKKVMLVYEMPGNNLDCSYGWDAYINEGSDRLQKLGEADLRDKLTNIWWRLDDDSEINTDNLHFMMKNKKYVSLPLFLLYYCRLINLYVTNLCRFELYKIDEKGWERSLNLHDLQGEELNAIDIAYEDVFSKELEAFSPDIILATSNPYNYLCNKEEVKNKYILDKIPHPATQRLYKEYQGIINIFYTLQCLGKHDILTKSMAAELSEKCMSNLLNS